MNLIPANELVKLVDDTLDKDFPSSMEDPPVWLVMAKKRLEFEKLATKAARIGAEYLALEASPIPVEQLIEQGFTVKEIIRKDALLRSLDNAVESAENRALASAERFIFENPCFLVVKSDSFFHRNILYSLLHLLWNQGRLNESTSTPEFEANLRIGTNINEDQILSNRFLLKSMVDDFKSLKMAQSQAELIKKDQAFLPVGMNKAFIISWAKSEWTSNPINRFSPQLLYWYSSNWLELVRYLNTATQRQAGLGRSYCRFSIAIIDKNINFLELDNEVKSFDIKPFPLIILWKELIFYRFIISAQVMRCDEDGTIISTQVIDTSCNFDLNGLDELTLSIGWVTPD